METVSGEDTFSTAEFFFRWGGKRRHRSTVIIFNMQRNCCCCFARARLRVPLLGVLLLLIVDGAPGVSSFSLSIADASGFASTSSRRQIRGRFGDGLLIAQDGEYSITNVGIQLPLPMSIGPHVCVLTSGCSNALK